MSDQYQPAGQRWIPGEGDRPEWPETERSIEWPPGPTASGAELQPDSSELLVDDNPLGLDEVNILRAQERVAKDKLIAGALSYAGVMAAAATIGVKPSIGEAADALLASGGIPTTSKEIVVALAVVSSADVGRRLKNWINSDRALQKARKT